MGNSISGVAIIISDTVGLTDQHEPHAKLMSLYACTITAWLIPSNLVVLSDYNNYHNIILKFRRLTGNSYYDKANKN